MTDDEPTQVRDPQAPKGRPTPKRSEAQGQRRTLAKPASNRKEAAKRAREARRKEMAQQREAMMTGDERYLPYRDKGPVRRYVRDFVDAKWCVAEFFMPVAIVILVLSMVNAGALQAYVLLVWMALILLIVLDSAMTVVRLRKRLRERFPDENRKGAVAYALMRTLQIRKMRLPKPQVARGEHP